MKKKVKKKADTNDIFDNISNTLDTSFDGEEIEEVVTVKDNAEKCKDLINSESSMEDGEYIRDEIKNLISSIEVAMDKVQQNLKIGSSARENEVFGQLANAKANAIKELIMMNKAILDAKVRMKKQATPKNMTVNNLNMSSSDLLKFINNTKENNSLKDVEAKFRIENEQIGD